jgi:hypothetical protein
VALGRKLVSTPQASATHIKKLLKKGVLQGEISLAIDWLTTDNLSSGYQLEVQSGRSLHEKWDRIQSAMARSSCNSGSGQGEIKFSAINPASVRPPQ